MTGRFIAAVPGNELASKARDLALHFEQTNTPVMIGEGTWVVSCIHNHILKPRFSSPSPQAATSWPTPSSALTGTNCSARCAG